MSTHVKANVRCEDADKYLDQRFSEPGAALPEEVAKHLKGCARCARLHRWATAEADAPAIGEDLEASIRRRLLDNLKPVNPLPSARVLAIRFLGAFALLAAVLMGFAGLAGRDEMSLPQLLTVAVILGAGAVFLSVSLSWQMIPGQYQRVPAPLLIAAFAAGFLVVVASMFPWEAPGQILAAGWGCTRAGLIMAIPVGALLVFLAVRGAPLSFRSLGASLGATSGLLALTVLQFSCHNQQAGHILVWHGAVMLVCLAAGYLLGIGAEHIAARRD